MKMTGRIRTLAAIVAVVLSLTSCGRSLQRKVAVEALESVEMVGLSGVDINLRVRNDTRKNLSLDSCRVAFRLPSGVLLRGELRGGASVGPRTTETARLRMKITSARITALPSLLGRLSRGDVSDVTVDLEAVARLGSHQRKIYAPGMSLSKILSNFGVSEKELSTYFQ